MGKIDSLLDEIDVVKGFLAETPEDSIHERESWEYRLEVLRERLRELSWNVGEGMPE